MKKGLVLAVVMVFLMAPGLVGFSQGADQPIKLTYSNFFPPTHVQSILADAWCKEVEKRTNGKVKIEYYPGQTLTKAAEVYDGVVTNVSDLGLSVLGYTRGRFPLIGVVDMPLGYRDGKTATKVINAVLQKFQPKEFNDVKVMYLHAHGPGFVHTREKPVKKLEDMKGLKLRSHGVSANFVEALGGTPVAQPMPETYQLIQKGVVDGAVYPLEANKGWKLGEVCKFATLAYDVAYTTGFFVVMNKGKWEKLPGDVKKVIEEINKEWVEKTGKAWDEIDEEGLKFFKEKGGQTIALDEAEQKRWKKAVKPIIDKYVAEIEGKGVKGKEVVEFIEGMLKSSKQ